MEAGTAVHHSLGVLGDLLVQNGGRLVEQALDGILGAHSQAPAAAHALIRVDGGLAVCDLGGVMGADALAGAAAYAIFLLDEGLAGVVLLHFAGPGAAAHADIFQASAHARLLVTLEVGQGNEHIRVHHRPADLGGLDVLAALHGHLYLVRALEAVGNEDVAAGGVGGEAVDIGGINVVQRVFPAAHIERVAVGEEGLSALALHQVGHGPGPVGTQIGKVAGLAEMHLDGHILILHVDVAEAGGHHQTGQLLGQGFPPAGAAEVRKVYFGCLAHNRSPFPSLFYSLCAGWGI